MRVSATNSSAANRPESAVHAWAVLLHRTLKKKAAMKRIMRLSWTHFVMVGLQKQLRVWFCNIIGHLTHEKQAIERAAYRFYDICFMPAAKWMEQRNCPLHPG